MRAADFRRALERLQKDRIDAKIEDDGIYAVTLSNGEMIAGEFGFEPGDDLIRVYDPDAVQVHYFHIESVVIVRDP